MEDASEQSRCLTLSKTETTKRKTEDRWTLRSGVGTVSQSKRGLGPSRASVAANAKQAASLVGRPSGDEALGWKGKPYTRSDVKKAIVTLAEGAVDRRHRRDLKAEWHSRITNPTSPGPAAALILIDRSCAVQGQAGQGADRRQAQDRRPQQQGSRDVARHRRRPQAALSHHRFQASPVGRRGHRRADRI